MKLKSLILITIFGINLGWSQVSITSATPYTQNFDGLGTVDAAWINNIGLIAGWYSTVTSTNLVANAGGGTSNKPYNCGNNADRALGAISSSITVEANIHRIAIRMKNDHATDAITSFQIAYTGEQWRKAAATGESLVFEYQVGPSITAIIGGTWTPVSALDFASIQSGSSAQLDGNAAANRLAKTGLVSVSVPAGQEIMFRWTKNGISGHLLAVDDLTITPSYSLSNKDFDFNSNFSLYPNPVTNTLNIDSRNNIALTSVSVYNTLGQLVLEQNANLKNIDVSALTQGTYLIKIISDKGIASSKFVKE